MPVSGTGRGLTQRTILGILWVSGGKGALALMQVLVLAILARLITPAEFGVVSAALVVIAFSVIFSQVGLGPALVQREVLEPRHVLAAFVSSVSLGVALAVIIWLAAPALEAFFRIDGLVPVLRVLAVIFPLSGLSVASDALIRRDLEFGWIARVDVVTYVVGYGLVGVSLALAGWGVWALVTAQIAQRALDSAVLLMRAPVPLRARLDRRAYLDLLEFGGGFTIAKVANFFALQGDNMVVARFLGPTALGLYGRAFQLGSTPASALGGVLDVVLFPAMARVQDDARRLATAFRRGVSLIALVTLPVSVVLFVIGPELIRVVLGSHWDGAVLPFRILVTGMLFRSSYKMSDSLARATGSVYRRAWRQMVYAALVIGGASVGQLWGITGVAVAALVALVANFFMMAHLSLSVAGMRWSDIWQPHRPVALLTAVITPGIWLATELLRHVHAPAVAIVVVIPAVALAATIALLVSHPSRFLGPDATWVFGVLGDLWRRVSGRKAALRPAPVAVRADGPASMGERA